MEFKVTNVFIKNQDALNGGFRYIVNSGGSRSSKSYSIMQLLCVLLLTNKKYKISCYRNLRIDCIDTVGEDFKDIIMGSMTLQSKFVHNVKNATWKCKANGSMIYFAGTEKIHKALGQKNNVIFLNEISEFSQDVFNQLDQRTRDAIFIDYNPSKSFWIEKYRENKTATFLHSTYKDNPFLTEGITSKLESYNPFKSKTTYVEKMVIMHNGEEVSDTNQPPPHVLNIKNGTADRYMYSVYCLGIGSEKQNRVYRDWKICTEEFFYELEYISYFGLDFGISSPTAVVEIKYDGDRTFYLHQRLYKPSSTMGMPIYEWLRTMMQPVITDDMLIVCDSAKKTMVDDLKYSGLKAVGALKGQGSKPKRIEQVQGFNIVYTETSRDLEEEYYEYSYKLDRYGLVTDDVDPANPDHCFVGSTMITTINGLIPIKNIKKGDLVLTSKGYKPVLKVFDNGIKKINKYTMLLDTFNVSLQSTPDHRIKTTNGWKKISELNPLKDKIYLHKNLTELNTKNIKGKITTRNIHKDFIGLYGNTLTEKSKKDIISTTKIKTHQTTKSKTSTVLTENSTPNLRGKKDLHQTRSSQKSFSKKELLKQRSGIVQWMELNGIKNTPKKQASEKSLLDTENVIFVKKNILQDQKIKNFVQEDVNQNREEEVGLITLKKSATNAKSHLSQINISKENIVAVNVEELQEERVYDLMVADCHEYFANGILVHNCMDAAGYLISYLIGWLRIYFK